MFGGQRGFAVHPHAKLLSDSEPYCLTEEEVLTGFQDFLSAYQNKPNRGVPLTTDFHVHLWLMLALACSAYDLLGLRSLPCALYEQYSGQ